MKKIWIFDRSVRELFWKTATAILAVFSVVIIVVPEECQYEAVFGLAIVLAVCYVGVWIYANRRRSVIIKIRNTKVIIKQGDLFKQKGKKVIPANEYFDTIVGSGIVDPQSLHAQYISKYAGVPPDKLYEDIVTELRSVKPRVIDETRVPGRQIAYKLGTVFNDQKGFLLVAYSRFDKDNRAFLCREDIAECYINMWDQIDIHRGSDSINLPVLGASGMVRSISTDYSPQQLIELILWSFRVSGINLARNATLNIIVHSSLVDDVNFLKLKNYSD